MPNLQSIQLQVTVYSYPRTFSRAFKLVENILSKLTSDSLEGIHILFRQEEESGYDWWNTQIVADLLQSVDVALAGASFKDTKCIAVRMYDAWDTPLPEWFVRGRFTRLGGQLQADFEPLPYSM